MGWKSLYDVPVVGDVVGAVSGYDAAVAQGNAAEAAAGKQQELIQWMMQQQQAAGNAAYDMLGQKGGWAADLLNQYGDKAFGYLQQGFNQGADTLQSYGQQATGALGQGYQTGLDQLYGGQAAAAGAIGQGLAGAQGQFAQGLGAAQDSLSTTLGYQSTGQQLQNMLANGPYNDFTSDPGYQFRLQQGQDAITHAASAAGGRHGGDTLKALSEYNQNFASNEFGNYVNRQNSAMGQMAGLAGLGAGAAGQLAGMNYGAGGQLAGMSYGAGNNLANLFSGTGQQAAGMSQQYGQNLGSMLGMQGTQLADLYTGQGQALGNFQMGLGSQQADLQWQQAMAQANALTGGAAGQSQLGQLMLPTFSAGVPYAGAGAAGMQQLGMMGLYALLSDERQKTNVKRDAHDQIEEFLGELEPVAFDYKDTRHGSGRHIGVMAQDVERSAVGREMVIETPDGKALDTRKVLSAVLAALANINARLEALETR